MNCKKVIVYGYGKRGKAFCTAFERVGKVVSVIDKNTPECPYPIYKTLSDTPESVKAEAVIITPAVDSEIIKKEIAGLTDIAVFTLDEIYRKEYDIKP
jgi:S-adenosylhomocysteine hydrolase